MAHRIDFESLFSLEGRIALISGASVDVSTSLRYVGAGARCRCRATCRQVDLAVQKLRDQAGRHAITMDVTSRESVDV